MKTLKRSLWIMIFAGIVAGLLYAFAQTTFAQSLVPERGERGERPDAMVEGDAGYLASDGATSEIDEDRDRNRDRDGSGERDGERNDEISLTEALPGMAKHMGVIVLLVVAIILLRRGMNKLSPGRKLQASR